MSEGDKNVLDLAEQYHQTLRATAQRSSRLKVIGGYMAARISYENVSVVYGNDEVTVR